MSSNPICVSYVAVHAKVRDATTSCYTDKAPKKSKTLLGPTMDYATVLALTRYLHSDVFHKIKSIQSASR